MTATPESTNPLARCESLSELEDEVLAMVLERCSTVEFEAGEVLIRQGDPGESLWVLLEGRATASISSHEGRTVVVGEFGPYDVIGEMAILTGAPRTADVQAGSAGKALVLLSQELNNLISLHPEIGVVLTHMVADRLGDKRHDGLGSKVIDRYRISRCVGRGSMAIVYEARDIETQERVALKMMSHRLIYEKGARARFQREADILLELEHANISRVHRRFSAYRTCFIAMEFCDGCDLSGLSSGEGALSEGEARQIIGQLAAGLHYLHTNNVVHRDLKPQNVLVSRAGRVTLADFGLARASMDPLDGALTTPGTLVGTPYYMSPELLMGRSATPSSDLYALGCIAHELLTGKLPFRADSLCELASLRRNAILPPKRELAPGLSADLYELLRACLSSEPNSRSVDLSDISRWGAPLSTSALSFGSTHS